MNFFYSKASWKMEGPCLISWYEKPIRVMARPISETARGLAHENCVEVQSSVLWCRLWLMLSLCWEGIFNLLIIFHRISTTCRRCTECTFHVQFLYFFFGFTQSSIPAPPLPFQKGFSWSFSFILVNVLFVFVFVFIFILMWRCSKKTDMFYIYKLC